MLKSGTYTESVDLRSSGRDGEFITIEGIEDVLFDGAKLDKYDPVFDTKGNSYIKFKNFRVRNARSAVEISSGSQHIIVEDVKTDNCQFAVKMKDASFISIKRCLANNSRNAFRGEGSSHDVAFEDVEAYGSKDIYKGHDLNYLNGDGFIFENDTYNLSFKNIKSSRHWDAGLDIKGSHVMIENVVAEGNKNGLKLWGNDITVKNVLVYDSKSQVRPDGKKVDGAGVNVRSGDTQILNSTFVDNEGVDVKVAEKGKLNLENCLVARRISDGILFGDYGEFSAKNGIWFDRNTIHFDPKYVRDGNIWADPQFRSWDDKDFQPSLSSPAVRDDKTVIGADAWAN